MLFFFTSKRREVTEESFKEEFSKKEKKLDEKKKEILINLKKIIQHSNYKIFINVFKMNTDECGIKADKTDFENSILNALSKGNCSTNISTQV